MIAPPQSAAGPEEIAGAGPAPLWRFAALVGGAALATCAAVVVGADDPFVGFALLLNVAIAWAVWRAPLRHSLAVLLMVVLTVDNPQERPASGQWESPLYPLGSLLFENLNKLTGLEALRFAPLDLLLVWLVIVALLRGSSAGVRESDGAPTRPAGVLTGALLLAMAGLALAEGWGVARGGDFKSSLWQVRQMAAGPVLGLLFASAFRSPRELTGLGKIVIGAAFFKTAVGLYFREVICRPKNFKPPYVTSHSDTLLFVLALVVLIALWHESRTRKSFWAMVFGGAWLMFGIYINGRRLAYVALAAALLALFALAPRTRFKRTVIQGTVLAIPVALLYLGAGWSSTAGVFRPAQLVKSVVSSKDDRSTQTRDIENYNLVQTLKVNPLLGTGFGHEYRELSRADTIVQFFPQYRLIPHNSLLGLWAFTGLVGFWLVWLPLVVGVFLAVRSYRVAKLPAERALALSVVGMAIAFSAQAYGDMGLQSWTGAFLLAAVLASASRLAVSVGAWPQPGGPPGI